MGRVTGIVISIEAGRASIECEAAAQAACSTCASGRGCGWRRSDNAHPLLIDAETGSRPLEPGDLVELEVDDGRLLQAACRLYLPPLCGLLAGPSLLRWGGLESGTAPYLAAVCGLGLGALLAWRWTRSGVPLRWQLAAGAGGGAGQA